MSVARGKLAAGGRYESSDLQHDTTGERHPVSLRFRNQGEAPKATTPVSLQPCGSSVPAHTRAGVGSAAPCARAAWARSAGFCQQASMVSLPQMCVLSE